MWFKVDDRFPRHPKTRAAAKALGGRHALGRVMGVWLEAGTFCSEFLTDGFITEAQVSDLLADGDPEAVAEALVTGGLWRRLEAGYQFHEWDHHQPSADSVKQKRERDRARKAAGAGPSGGAQGRLPEVIEAVDGIVVESSRIPQRLLSDSAATRAGIATESEAVPERSRARDPVPSRPDSERSKAEEQRALRARPVRMLVPVWLVRPQILAAVHRIVQSGPPYVDAHGEPVLSEIHAQIKLHAKRHLHAEWTGRELASIVDAALGRRAALLEAELLHRRFEQREWRALGKVGRGR